MRKVTFILLLLASLIHANEYYEVDTNSSNAYYKATSDVVFFGTDEIIGVNKSITGHIEKVENRLKGEVILAVTGFETQNSTRDKHVREILNYTKYKIIQFQIESTRIVEGQLFLVGILRINNISSQIEIPVIENKTDISITYSGKTKVKYRDFGMEPPTLGGFIKRAEEDIEIGGKITFVKAE